jgi:phosphonoacetaldehyde hydrolase
VGKPYCGPLKAVIFDWAGTVVDHGSLAPLGVFIEVFKRFGVAITVAEARAPMGLPKREHIKAVGALPGVAERWRAVHGSGFSEADIDRLYAVFEPLNIAVVAQHAELVPQAVETVSALRARGLKIGSTTGYTKGIMAALAPLAAARGYVPDCLVCVEDVPVGRPTPLMVYRAMLDLGVWPAAACVKVDDTVPGLDEGSHAGTWTVAVAVSGNAFGLGLRDTKALPPATFAERRAAAQALLREAQPHYVIDSVADLLPVAAEIDERLRRGEQP